MRRTFRFEDDHFVLEDEEPMPPRRAKARLDLPAQSVTLDAAGEQAQASLTGAIAAGEIHPYRLALEAGQQLSVTIQSPYDNVWLSVFGSEDQTVLRSIRSDTVRWTGKAPSSQEYLISAVAPGSASPYTLTIEVAGEAPAGSATPAPAAPALATKSIHLLIDGAAAAAPVLDVLQQYNASADFFVETDEFVGTDEAAQSGMALVTAVAARHGIGLIAGPIKALTSDGRDALFANVNAARQAFGDQPVHCLRLPAAASDAYTRAAAAEQGYDVLLWDIDASSLAPEALLSQVFPNAVVRFDGDSDELAGKLAALLPALAQQGYSVEALCNE
jgi:hypothetical protein